MILKVGPYIFHQHYVAFHLVRDNAYTPWRAVGVYVSYNGRARCKYVPEMRYNQRIYEQEVEMAGDLCSTYEFLDNWRKIVNQPNSAITKVVNYYSLWHNPGHILHDMCQHLLGSIAPNKMAFIAIMVKSREKYFPVVFQHGKKRQSVVEELKKAGLYEEFRKRTKAKV